MNSKVKLGIIGVGHMGNYHVNVARQIEEYDFQGIYDVSNERATYISEKYNVPKVDSINELFKKVDCVIIAVPTFLHYKIAKESLLAGKHILLEKPISQTVQEAEELMELSRKENLTVLIGHIERFNGAILELSKIVKDPFLIESRRFSPYNPRIQDNGVVLDMMIHDIDIILNLIKDDIVYLSASGNEIKTSYEDTASVVLKFKNQCIANIVTSRTSQAKIRTLNVSQENAYIRLNFTDQEIELQKQASSDTYLNNNEIKYKQEAIIEKIFVHKENPLKLEHEHFIQCVKNQTQPIVNGESDIKTLLVAHQILQSIYGKQEKWKFTI